jgi:hypothetical protein
MTTSFVNEAASSASPSEDASENEASAGSITQPFTPQASAASSRMTHPSSSSPRSEDIPLLTIESPTEAWAELQRDAAARDLPEPVSYGEALDTHKEAQSS